MLLLLLLRERRERGEEVVENEGGGCEKGLERRARRAVWERRRAGDGVAILAVGRLRDGLRSSWHAV
jgi:hypothetical protein